MRQEADRRFGVMLEARREYEPWWLELRTQFAPNRGRFTVREKPKRDIMRKNSKPRQIPDDFAAGIKSGLTLSSRPWFTALCDGNARVWNPLKQIWLSFIEYHLPGEEIWVWQSDLPPYPPPQLLREHLLHDQEAT